MSQDLPLMSAPAIPAGPITITPSALARKEAALEASALIGKVTNAAENDAAAKARAQLKAVFRDFERSRVAMKEPALQYGRDVDRAVAPHKDELDQEDGRLAELVSEFALAERRRMAEEERLQRAELERIEREKQQELQRIADEQARVERQAREAREAAERLAQAATDDQAKAAAEAARVESERLQREAEKTAQESKAAVETVEARAGQAAYYESRPVLPTKARGQSERDDWEVEVTNPYDLAKFHPDCVTITPLIGKVKAALNEGRVLQGVRARKILTVNQRAARTPAVINI
ncbi:MAG: hypothetical protein KGL39_15785 [Patescibacteria group bacterium]|nr:hypothetical protein [Patescibacteria group bacterium]